MQTLGVPVEGKVRVQLNLKVEHAPAVSAVANFRDFVFPIMWLEEVRIRIFWREKIASTDYFFPCWKIKEIQKLWRKKASTAQLMVKATCRQNSVSSVFLFCANYLWNNFFSLPQKKKSKRLKIDALLFCCAARDLLANSNNTRRANICAVSVHSVRTTEISTHNNRHEGHEAQLLELIFSVCGFHQLILIFSSDVFSIRRALANSHLRFAAGSIWVQLLRQQRFQSSPMAWLLAELLSSFSCS